MKKYISMLFIALAMTFTFASCDDSDVNPGGTAVKDMAGQWDVTVDAVDDNGNTIYTDPYGLGTITITTYNTSANKDTEMFINDNGNFYNFTFKVDVDYANKTFSATDVPYDAAGTGNATVTDGKVLMDAAKNLHGMPNDSIDFKIKFSDDQNKMTYHVHGQRYTGF